MTEIASRWLLAILAVASSLRLFRLARHDAANDEVFYGFRSIGLFDSLNAPDQPTPFEWFDPLPWWVHLSFHDHPPLGFWIMHLCMRVFGPNLVGMRIASALAGIATVWLTYLVAKRLFRSERVALLAAAMLAVNSCHVWFSRIGMQESLVIFFMMLATWLFLKTLEDARYFYGTVAATGIAMLMKYTAVILVPIFLIWCAWQRRDLLRWQRVVAAGALLVAILSPVLVYNVMLYRARHHFDFQISHLLGQQVAEWQVRPGREVGSLMDRLRDLPLHFAAAYGPIFSALTILALGLGLWIRRHVDLRFVGLSLACLVVLVVGIGPQLWFLAMLAPVLALLAAASLCWAASKQRWVVPAVAVVLVAELAFSINTSFPVAPLGWESWTYSVLHRDSGAWGYNQLEAQLQQKMEGRFAAQAFPLRFSYAQELNREAVERDRRAGKTPYRVLFVSDTSLSGIASLWYVSRHQIYDAWPSIDDTVYLQAIAKDPRFFFRRGFEEVVFIRAADTLLRDHADPRAAIAVEAAFRAQGVRPRPIAGPRGQPAFWIYEAR